MGFIASIRSFLHSAASLQLGYSCEHTEGRRPNRNRPRGNPGRGWQRVAAGAAWEGQGQRQPPQGGRGGESQAEGTASPEPGKGRLCSEDRQKPCGWISGAGVRKAAGEPAKQTAGALWGGGAEASGRTPHPYPGKKGLMMSECHFPAEGAQKLETELQKQKQALDCKSRGQALPLKTLTRGQAGPVP